MLLQRIELAGFDVADSDPTPLQRVHHALAMLRPDDAATILEAAVAEKKQRLSDPGWRLAQAVVAEELGDAATAQAALRSALASDPHAGDWLSPLFRHYLDRFEVPLRSILGRGYFAFLAEYTIPTLRTHFWQGRMLDLLIAHTGGLDRLPADPGPLPETGLTVSMGRIIRIELKYFRGRAWRRARRIMFALRDLQGAWRRADEFLAQIAGSPEGPSLGVHIRRLKIHIGRELALCYQARGEPDRAMQTLLETVDQAPAPTIAADIYTAEAELAALRNHPRWPQLERRQRIGSSPGSRIDSR